MVEDGYYGLHICVLPKFTGQDLIPGGMVLGSRVFERLLNPEGGVLMVG